jgi:hypothetical protein
MRDAALARLEWWLRDASRADPDQWTPGHQYLEGALLAYRRIGVLSRSEEKRWRTRFAGAAAMVGFAAVGSARPLSVCGGGVDVLASTESDIGEFLTLGSTVLFSYKSDYQAYIWIINPQESLVAVVRVDRVVPFERGLVGDGFDGPAPAERVFELVGREQHERDHA